MAAPLKWNLFPSKLVTRGLALRQAPIPGREETRWSIPIVVRNELTWTPVRKKRVPSVELLAERMGAGCLLLEPWEIRGDDVMRLAADEELEPFTRRVAAGRFFKLSLTPEGRIGLHPTVSDGVLRQDQEGAQLHATRIDQHLWLWDGLYEDVLIQRFRHQFDSVMTNE